MMKQIDGVPVVELDDFDPEESYDDIECPVCQGRDTYSGYSDKPDANGVRAVWCYNCDGRFFARRVASVEELTEQIVADYAGRVVDMSKVDYKTDPLLHARYLTRFVKLSDRAERVLREGRL